MNAGIIARVSTDKQLENTSVDEQLRRCREYCQERGHTVTAEKVEAISGAFVLARSEFISLLEEAAHGRIGVIVSDIPDRLGRGDTIAKLELLAQLNGARIEYAQPGRDTNTIEGLIQHSAEQMVSGIERLNIIRRTTQGKEKRARDGWVVNTRFRPMGYEVVSTYDDRGRKTSCTLKIREDEAPIIRQIFYWLVFEGLTTYAIMRRLDAAGIPTMSQRAPEERPWNIGEEVRWHRSTVLCILTNPVYKGEWTYGRWQTIRQDTPGGIKHHVKERANYIAVPVPVIINPELWQAAQDQLAEHRQRGFKPTKYEYLLRGRVRCARCGRLLTGKTMAAKRIDGTHYHFYRCKGATLTPQQCQAKQIKGADLEAAVWDFICTAFRDDEVLFGSLERRRAEAGRARQMLMQTLTALDVQDRQTQTKMDRFLDLYGAGEMPKDKYLAKKREGEAEIEKRAAERKDLEKQLQDRQVITPDLEAALRATRAKIGNNLDGAAFADKAHLLDLLAIRCIYDDRTGDLTITGALGEHSLNIKSSSSGA